MQWLHTQACQTGTCRVTVGFVCWLDGFRYVSLVWGVVAQHDTGPYKSYAQSICCARGQNYNARRQRVHEACNTTLAHRNRVHIVSVVQGARITMPEERDFTQQNIYSTRSVASCDERNWKTKTRRHMRLLKRARIQHRGGYVTPPCMKFLIASVVLN